MIVNMVAPWEMKYRYISGNTHEGDSCTVTFGTSLVQLPDILTIQTPPAAFLTLSTSNSSHVLAGVAALLGRESGALPVGERTNRLRIRRIRAIICADDSVDNVGDLLTMQLGPDQVLLNVDTGSTAAWAYRNWNW